MKILFTSVGRRVELLQQFRKASEELGIPLEIWASDIVCDAPALYFADRTVLSPRIKSEDYIPFLMDVSSREGIDCIVPTIDTDLLILSQYKAEFLERGVRILVSDEDKIAICRDKNYTSSFFVSAGLHAPLPVNNLDAFQQMKDKGEIDFPVFIKPKDGSSSINAFRVDDMEDLVAHAKSIGDYIIQPFIEGREYTVDIFCDFEGKPVFITPRERLAVRAGEVLKTRVSQDAVMIGECKKLVEAFSPCGPMTVQLIRQKDTGIDYYIEINPRFGGGVPLSMKAGADSAAALLRLLAGEKLSYQEHAARDGLEFSRFDQSICVNGNDRDRQHS